MTTTDRSRWKIEEHVSLPSIQELTFSLLFQWFIKANLVIKYARARQDDPFALFQFTCAQEHQVHSCPKRI